MGPRGGLPSSQLDHPLFITYMLLLSTTMYHRQTRYCTLFIVRYVYSCKQCIYTVLLLSLSSVQSRNCVVVGVNIMWWRSVCISEDSMHYTEKTQHWLLVCLTNPMQWVWAEVSLVFCALLIVKGMVQWTTVVLTAAPYTVNTITPYCCYLSYAVNAV